MSENSASPDILAAEETDEIAEFVQVQKITAECFRVETRPDVSVEEQLLWQRQDPDFPPEHYRCILKRAERVLEVYQTVGADYPDEDDEAGNSDLYEDSRALLLSPEFLIESAALKANSIDESGDVTEWQANGYCETTTPDETYNQFQKIRTGLKELLDDDLYRTLVRLAVEAELERDEESEELS